MFCPRWALAGGWALALVALAGCDRLLDPGPAAQADEVTKIRQALAQAPAASQESGSASSSAAAEPTGWANLKASVKYLGSPPALAKPAGITPECTTHPLVDESLVVGSAAEFANVVLYLRSKAPKIHERYEAAASAQVALDNAKCRFEPHVQIMRTSQKLQLKNSDGFLHNSKGTPGTNDEFNLSLSAGSQLDQALPKEEPLPFQIRCSVHPWMNSWLIVRNDPYADVSDRDGSLAIGDLPAGVELEFQLWHERGGFLKSAKIAGQKVDAKGRFKVKLEPGQDLQLDIQVPGDSLK